MLFTLFPYPVMKNRKSKEYLFSHLFSLKYSTTVRVLLTRVQLVATLFLKSCWLAIHTHTHAAVRLQATEFSSAVGCCRPWAGRNAVERYALCIACNMRWSTVLLKKKSVIHNVSDNWLAFNTMYDISKGKGSPPQPLRGLLPILLLGEQRHNGCEQFA